MNASAETLLLSVVIGPLLLLHLAGFFPTKKRTGRERHSHLGTIARWSRLQWGVDQGSFDIGRQLNAVMASTFDKQRLMNGSEYKVFKVIESELAATGHRVFAQTSLGEVLRSDDETAFRAINSKRVDFLVVDRAGWPLLAVEYQGAGHYQGTATARDAIKKEALRRAGVAYLEITDNDNDNYVRDRVRALLELASPTSGGCRALA